MGQRSHRAQGPSSAAVKGGPSGARVVTACSMRRVNAGAVAARLRWPARCSRCRGLRPSRRDSAPPSAAPLAAGAAIPRCPRHRAELARRLGLVDRSGCLSRGGPGCRRQGAPSSLSDAGQAPADRRQLCFGRALLPRPADRCRPEPAARHRRPVPARLLAGPAVVRHRGAPARSGRHLCVRRPPEAARRPDSVAEDAESSLVLERQPPRVRDACRAADEIAADRRRRRSAALDASPVGKQPAGIVVSPDDQLLFVGIMGED